MDAKEARRRDRFEQLTAAAAKEAIQSSGLTVTESNAGRIGVIISSAIGGLTTLQEAVLIVNNDNPRQGQPVHDPDADVEWRGGIGRD